MATRTTFLFHSGDFGRPFLLVWEKRKRRQAPLQRGIGGEIPARTHSRPFCEVRPYGA